MWMLILNIGILLAGIAFDNYVIIFIGAVGTLGYLAVRSKK